MIKKFIGVPMNRSVVMLPLNLNICTDTYLAVGFSDALQKIKRMKQ